jgi:predicted CXXCH cytochrome family protein
MPPVEQTQMKWLAGLIFCFVGLARASDYQLFMTEKVFEAEVKFPSKIAVCGENLWTYSVEKQSLAVVAIRTKNLKTVELPREFKRPISLTALSCFLGRILILVQDRQKPILMWGSPDPSRWKIGGGIEKLSLPNTGQIFDLFCDSNKCGILSEKGFFQTVNLRSWPKMDVPQLLEMDMLRSHKNLNPFADWQDSLILSKPFFLRGAFLASGEQMFLDGFRAQFGYSHQGHWVRWGKWGAWEGSLYAPRAFAVGEHEQIFVADSYLKAIFVFAVNGIYLGSLSLDQERIYSPRLVQGLTVKDGVIYVADFFEHRVFGFRASRFPEEIDFADGPKFRKNLFRRIEVLDSPTSSCLSCHDGTKSDFLYRFAEQSVHGPEMCSKCHDPHHTSKKNHYLRDTAECISCHKEVAKPRENHVWNSKGGECLDCHAAHSVLKNALRFEPAQLCVRCHSDRNHQHRSVELVSEAVKTQVKLENGKISCLTCHSPHHQQAGAKFVTASEPRVRFCASCHGEKASQLDLNFHARWKKRGQ